MARPIIKGPGQPRRNWTSQLGWGQSSGSVVPAEYQWGTHAQATHNAEGVKSRIFASVVAAVVVTAAVPTFVFAPQQAYADVNQSFIEAPLAAGATPRTIPRLVTVPQVDLTQQGWIGKPQAARQGAVPSLVQSAPQSDPSQLAAKLTPSQPAAPVVVSQVAGFFSIPPQTTEQPTRVVWTPQVPAVVSYALESLYAAPQADLYQLPARVFPSVVTPPIFTGAVPPLTLAGQPQYNTDQLPAITWTPLVFGQPPPVVLDEILIGGDDAPRKKKKRRKSEIEKLNDLLDKVVEENAAPAPPTAKAVKQLTKAIADQDDDDDDEEALIALT